MKRKVISKVLSIALVFLMVGTMFGGLPSTVSAAGKFNIGDTVEVQNTGAIHLAVRNVPAGSLIITRMPDGTHGEIIGGSQRAALGANTFTWGMIRWGNGQVGWSAERWPGGVWYLRKITAAPEAPVITSPGTPTHPGPVITDLTPTLRWNSLDTSVTEYAVAISRDPYGPANVIYRSGWRSGRPTSYTVTRDLEPGTRHRWQIEVRNRAGSTLSNILYFQTAEPVTPPPVAPVLLSPGSTSRPGPVINDLTPTLRWHAVAGASHYAIAIRENPPHGPIIYNPQVVHGTSHTVPAGELRHGENYRWNIQAFVNGRWSPVSNTLYFQIYTPDPEAPVITSPGTPTGPGPVINDLTPTLRWRGLDPSVTDFAVAISRHPYGPGNVIYRSGWISGRPTSYTVTRNLEPGTRHRWQIEVRNRAGSTLSNRLYFQTAEPVTPPPVAQVYVTPVDEPEVQPPIIHNICYQNGIIRLTGTGFADHEGVVFFGLFVLTGRDIISWRDYKIEVRVSLRAVSKLAVGLDMSDRIEKLEKIYDLAEITKDGAIVLYCKLTKGKCYLKPKFAKIAIDSKKDLQRNIVELVEDVLRDAAKDAVKDAVKDALGIPALRIERTPFWVPHILHVDGQLVTHEGLISGRKTFSTELLQNRFWALLNSPGELRVWDSQGRITGLLDGVVKEEIPYSMYDTENKMVIVFFQTGNYHLEVVGTEEDTYRLIIASTAEGQSEAIAVTGVPTTEATTHRFVIDPEIPIQAGVTMKTDADGDGVFEKQRTLQPPITFFAYSPEQMIVGQPITFDASGSYDADGNITSYRWDFGDGASRTGKVVEHIFALAGDYTVILTITDNDGVVSTHPKIVQVGERVGMPTWIWATITIGTILVLAVIVLIARTRRVV